VFPHSSDNVTIRISRRDLLQAAGIVCAAWLVYAGVWNAGFIWDDGTFVYDSEFVREPGGLAKLWFSTEPLDYFPLTSTSFWLEWRLWGDYPRGYHVTNVLLHTANAWSNHAGRLTTPLAPQRSWRRCRAQNNQRKNTRRHRP